MSRWTSIRQRRWPRYGKSAGTCSRGPSCRPRGRFRDGFGEFFAESRLSVAQRWTTLAGVSPLSGVLEYVTENPYDALLRLDKPGPGVAALGAVTYPGGPTVVAMNLYLYGDQAAGTVARETPLWQAWIQGRFPTPTELSK
jgi:hypothetical protein